MGATTTTTPSARRRPTCSATGRGSRPTRRGPANTRRSTRGRYSIAADIWRPSHVHYLVRHPGYRPLVTQLYFRGDPYYPTDALIKPSLVIDVVAARAGEARDEVVTFDIMLAAAR